MKLPAGAVRIRDLTPPVDPGLFPEIDEANGIVRGLKFLGSGGLNRRDYPEDVRSRAVRILEGAAINLSHLMPGQTQRNFETRFGWSQNVTNRADGTYGDVRFNPDHPYAKTFIWWARNNPRAIGFSPDMLVRKTVERDGRETVNEILTVFGIDLVADPSTTAGLTEAFEMEPLSVNPGEDGYEAAVGKLVAAIMCDPDMSIEDKKKKILLALKLMDDTPPTETPAETPAEEGLTAKAIVAAIVAANKPVVDGLTRLTEAMNRRPAAPTVTSVAREATEVPVTPPGPKQAPSVDEFVKEARTAGTW